MKLRRVVVTGLGAVSPIGNDVPTMWENAKAGVSGAKPITHFDASMFRTRFACEVKDFDAAEFMDKKEIRKVDTHTHYGIAAAMEAMRDCGIDDGDLLIIDKALTPREGSIAVCFVDGDFTLKRISLRDDGIWLEPANPQYPALHVTEGSNFQVWGIVSYVVKSM